MKFSLRAHSGGIITWSQPERSAMPSRNSLFVRSKRYRFNGIASNQLDAPFSLAKSREQISFLFHSLLISVFFDLIASFFFFLSVVVFCMIFCCFSWDSGRDREKGLDS